MHFKFPVTDKNLEENLISLLLLRTAVLLALEIQKLHIYGQVSWVSEFMLILVVAVNCSRALSLLEIQLHLLSDE